MSWGIVVGSKPISLTKSRKCERHKTGYDFRGLALKFIIHIWYRYSPVMMKTSNSLNVTHFDVILSTSTINVTVAIDAYRCRSSGHSFLSLLSPLTWFPVYFYQCAGISHRCNHCRIYQNTLILKLPTSSGVIVSLSQFHLPIDQQSLFDSGHQQSKCVNYIIE